jgi:hypothetical protein
MSDEFTIQPMPPKSWADGEIVEMSLSGFIRYRIMSRAELEKEFPKAPKALEGKK